MKSELLSQEKNVVTIKITIPAEDFEAEVSKTVASVGRKANIPGFRKGKAPRRVVEMRFGKEALRAETLEKMLPKALDQVVTEYDLETIDEPKVNIEAVSEGCDVVMTVIFEVQPEVTLPDLSSIEVEKPVFTVTDTMVDDALNTLRRNHGDWKAVDRPSASGDRVKAFYSTTIRDNADEVLSSHEPRVETFTLDTLSLKGEIVDALLGAKAGDKRAAEVQIDPQYEDKSLAGQRACYDFDVQEVLELIPAELSPDFFKKATGKELTSLEDLKAHLRASIEERLAIDSCRAAESDALRKVVEASTVELPQSMIDRQKEHLTVRAEENVKARSGLSLEEYYAQSGQDFEGFKSELDKQARENVAEYLVIDACAKHFSLEIQPEDLDKEIAATAAQYHVAPESVKEMLKKNPDELRSLISSARYRKAQAALLEAVKTVEVNKNVVETPEV